MSIILLDKGPDSEGGTEGMPESRDPGKPRFEAPADMLRIDK